MTDKGFIKDFTNHILEHVPTHPDWAESLAISCLSSCLDRDVYIVTKKGPLRLNLFFMVIGPSGLADKTVSMDHAIELLNCFKNQTNRDVVMPSRHTVEGLMKYMDEKIEGTNEYANTSGIIFRDEVTSLFKEIKNKSFAADEQEFLCELYDGKIQKRYTVKHKLQGYKNVYLNFISATTPNIFKVITVGFFTQGLGNRFMFTFDEYRDPIDVDSDDFLSNPYVYFEQNHDLFVEYATRLTDISVKCPRTVIGFEDTAAEKITKYYNEKRKIAAERFKNNKFDIEYSYIVRLPEFALKLAALHCISFNEESLDIIPQLIIRDLNVNWAIKKVEKHYEHYKRMLSVWNSTTTEEMPTSDESYKRVFFSKLEENQPIGKTALRNELNWHNQKLSKIFSSLINTLCEQDEIKIEKNGKSRLIMTTDYYYSTFLRK